MKILFVGATGLIAKPVITELQKSGHRLKLFSRTIKSSELSNSFDCYEGDVQNLNDIEIAINECDAVHISIANTNEVTAVANVVKVAKQHNIKLISYVSGCTVNKNNSWYWMIKNKLEAENLIINSGIPYLIYKPTWFFESLGNMIRGNKAGVVGKLPKYHWLSAKDFGKMVAESYNSEKLYNQYIYAMGPEELDIKSLLSNYVQAKHPEIKKVTSTPTGMLKFIGKLTRNSDMVFVAELFSYFEKVQEPNIDQTNNLIYTPKTTFKEWLAYL